ncbi:TonB-dependent receptor [Sphingosinicella sp. CPCC 101087]|uniref:TonB-dependent receptor n=1 Tax=Sphingosinicella sp. CPCC 101087 TaxID=2497754 RepID=UPI00101D54EE|nr:TonB-dependent receptor [Sphingosinicella sp. CPCC 101087]
MKFAFLLASTALAAAPAAAQQTPANSETSPDRQEAQDHVHADLGQQIIITAPGVRNLNILAGTATLSGSDLVRDMRPQLGETLARLPGVSATSFGPGASRPVLRGFQGERVRVMVDGIGSIDVSNTSADHAVTIDPITAERIEVLHGPAVLLFGSQAIGGAVNVFDRRIPRSVPDDPAHVDAIAAYASAAEEVSVAGGVDVPLGDGFVFHVDGSWRDTDDLRVGGFVLSPELRAEQLEIAEEEEAEGHAEEAAEARELAGLRGRLPNSATETWTAGLGLALIRDRGNIGVSFGIYDSRYGVPARPGAHHAHEEGEEGEEEEEGGHEHGDVPVSLDMRQYRGDLRAEVETGGGFLDRIRVRLAAADYEHTEFEGDEVGTIFRTQGMEGRIEAVQAERGGWRGVIGGQFFVRDFEAIGAEAFVPPNDTSQIGLFALQEVEFGPLELEGAVRYEHSSVSAPDLGLSRTFNAFSLAGGASYEVAPRIRVGANVSRAERAPSAEELFSNGPHVATQAFEVGDPTLDKERSLGGELYARANVSGFQLSATVYANRFDDYIFQAATGEEEDELPVFQYFQSDATYWGVELGASAPLGYVGKWRIKADTVADYVRATISDGGGPVPRIPPLRLLGGLEAESDQFDGRVEVEHIFEQDRIAAFETPTEGFTLVNASVTWRPWGNRNPTSLIFAANNIFDVEARRHASFTKDFVPLAGRDFRVSARVSF